MQEAIAKPKDGLEPVFFYARRPEAGHGPEEIPRGSKKKFFKKVFENACNSFIYII